MKNLNIHGIKKLLIFCFILLSYVCYSKSSIDYTPLLDHRWYKVNYKPGKTRTFYILVRYKATLNWEIKCWYSRSVDRFKHLMVRHHYHVTNYFVDDDPFLIGDTRHHFFCDDFVDKLHEDASILDFKLAYKNERKNSFKKEEQGVKDFFK